MAWTDYFDEIFLVALPERKERAEAELKAYYIPFTVFPAISHQTGAEGLKQTMKLLFQLNKHKKSILVFEDDILFVQDPNIIMPLCVQQLKKQREWDLFYLGINMDNDKNIFSHFIDKNLLPVEFGFSTHAIAYSRYAMVTIFEAFRFANFNGVAFDVMIQRIFYPLVEKGMAFRFCSYPMIATQADGYSFIEKKDSAYKYIQERFDTSIKHLLT